MTENNKILCTLSFDFLEDKQFYILDEMSVVCDSLFKLFFSDRVYQEASWTRDIAVHELTYYATFTKTDSAMTRSVAGVIIAKDVKMKYVVPTFLLMIIHQIGILKSITDF